MAARTLVGDVEVGEDVLHVVVVVERVDQPQHGLGGLGRVEGHGGARQHGQVGRVDLDAGRFDRGSTTAGVSCGLTRDLPGVTVGDDVLGAGLQRRHHQLVLVDRARNQDQMPLRANCHATAPGSAREPPSLENVDRMSAPGPVAVVGERVDVDRDAVAGHSPRR